MMHPSDTRWWRTHSADYVLGLLSNAERLVFERIMPTEPELQEFVIDWREKLQPMSDAVPPIQPPEHILPALISNIPVATQKDIAPHILDTTPDHASTAGTAMVVAASASGLDNDIESYDDTPNAQTTDQAIEPWPDQWPDQLADQSADQSAVQSAELSDKKTDFQNNNHLNLDASAEVLADGTAFMRLVESKQEAMDSWRNFAGLATAACLLVGMFGWVGFQHSQADKVEPTFDGISVVQNIAAQTLWVVDSSVDAQKLRVTSVAPPVLEEGQAFELWMVKPDEGGVISMGLLPTEPNVTSQIKVQRFSAEAESFGVSVEPANGSPESAPTGPVLYQGKIQTLSN